MHYFKKTTSFVLIVSLLFSLNACYVSQTTSNPQIIEDSGELVKRHYNVRVNDFPTERDPSLSAKLEYQPEYKYRTRKKISKKYKVPKLGAIFTGIILPLGVGYYAYTKAPNGQIFADETPTWVWLSMSISAGWLLGSIGSGRLSKTKYKNEYQEGPIQYQKRDAIPVANSAINVLANNTGNNYYTDNYGNIKVPLNDFELPVLKYHKDISMSFSSGNESFGNLSLNTKNFTKDYARIAVPVSELKNKDLASSRTVGNVLYGMESEVLNENRSGSWSYLSFGTKRGWVPNVDIENFYAVDYKLQAPDVNASVSRYVEKMIEPWQEKGRYEKMSDYRARVNETSRRKKIDELTTEGMTLIANTFIEIDKQNARLDYDTESEVFKIQFPDLNPIYVAVPINEAPNFERNFDNAYLRDVKYAYDGNAFAISYMVITHSSYPRRYIYDSKQQIRFNATQVVYNFKPIELNLQRFDFNNATEETNTIVEVGVADVDKDIPETNQENEDAIAVVIGNKDYSNRDVPSVDYALSDARTMKQYLIKTFGFKEENILYVENATQGNFNSLFGTESNYKGRLYDLVKPDESDVFIYYSGHGAPDLESNQGYFVPVDCDPAAVALNGYSTDVFYKNLSQLPYKSLTVVLDACFSGASERGMLIRNASPIFINAETSVLNDERSAVFSSSEGDQISSWYPEKYHSLFTYYFLKGLKGEADENGDEMITLQEMSSYIKGNVNPMARRLHRRDQNPQINGEGEKVIVDLR